MKKTQLKIFILISISLMFLSCDDTLTVQDVDNRTIPDSNVSFSQHIAPIFELKCVSCHGPGKTEAGLNLSTWAGVVADPQIVFPGDSANSILVWTVERRPGFPPMPPLQYVPLTPNQIHGVKTWIQEGALNN